MSRLVEQLPAGDGTSSQPCVGTLVAIDDDGVAMVDWPDNHRGAIAARSLVRLDADAAPVPVLLLFVEGDPAQPVVLGPLHDRVFAPEVSDAEVKMSSAASLEASVDGDRVLLNGKREVVLTAGKSSITLRRDGRIIVKGVEIVSRASRANKIKGATVNIN